MIRRASSRLRPGEHAGRFFSRSLWEERVTCKEKKNAQTETETEKGTGGRVEWLKGTDDILGSAARGGEKKDGVAVKENSPK